MAKAPKSSKVFGSHFHIMSSSSFAWLSAFAPVWPLHSRADTLGSETQSDCLSWWGGSFSGYITNQVFKAR